MTENQLEQAVSAHLPFEPQPVAQIQVPPKGQQAVGFFTIELLFRGEA